MITQYYHLQFLKCVIGFPTYKVDTWPHIELYTGPIPYNKRRKRKTEKKKNSFFYFIVTINGAHITPVEENAFTTKSTPIVGFDHWSNRSNGHLRHKPLCPLGNRAGKGHRISDRFSSSFRALHCFGDLFLRSEPAYPSASGQRYFSCFDRSPLLLEAFWHFG